MKWQKGPIIGRGSTATVSLATTVTGDVFAVKSTELSNSSFLQKEQQLLSKLSSPHVIEYIGFDIDYVNNVPMYNMLIEYAPGGTISDVIKKQGGCLNECLMRSYTHQILLGLDYLHSNNLVHCDIKCANILVCEDGVKIGDLGCAKLLDTSSSVISGTPIFMAPEVARGEKQGFAADVWAVGCAVVEMATGSNPWVGLSDPVSALYKIGYSEDVPVFPMWLSEKGKDFLSKCLQRKDEERWTVKQLLKHPFIYLNSSSKKIENLSKNSPSSILDQPFWDSLDQSESSSTATRFTNISGYSHVDRIRQLVEASPSCLPNWVDEEDWITVRINHIEETLKICQQNFYDNYDDVESESTRVELFLFSDSDVQGYSWSVGMMFESEVDVSSDTSVVVSGSLDFKNMNNSNRGLLIGLNLNFALLGHLFLTLVRYFFWNMEFHSVGSSYSPNWETK